VQLVYLPGKRIKNPTALTHVCRELRIVAFPLFLANHPFDCTPFRAGSFSVRSKTPQIDKDEDSEKLEKLEEYEKEYMSGLEFPKYVMNETNNRSIWSHQWLQGLEEELSNLFDEPLDNKSTIDKAPAAPLKQKAQRFVDFFMHNNSFIRSLKALGRENAAKIKNITILWGACEQMVSGEHIDVAPYSIAVMSVVCKLWLPGLRKVSLKQNLAAVNVCDKPYCQMDEFYWDIASGRFEALDFPLTEWSTMKMEEIEKRSILGINNSELDPLTLLPENPYAPLADLVRALFLLGEACVQVRQTKLKITCSN
jgi:hypothetical protein